MQDFSHGIIIYAIYVLIGFLVAAWITFKDYQAGRDLTVSDLPWVLLFTFLIWPVVVIVSTIIWLGDNFGKIEDFVLIKGKRNESKQKEQEKDANEFDKDEGDY